MSQQFDTPDSNDNRNYNYEKFPALDRAEYPIILEMIEKNSKVIDLGCGNGSLLERLVKEKNVVGHGMEISTSGVGLCRKKGLNVLEGKIDEPLPFADDFFDYSICNVTMQMVMYPEVLLKEMKRVSRFQVISFPNFGYWRNRLDLLICGRMPQPMLFGYPWYSTGHIHQFSVKDFFQLLNEIGNLKVVKATDSGNSIAFLTKIFPNNFLYIPVYLLKKI